MTARRSWTFSLLAAAWVFAYFAAHQRGLSDAACEAIQAGPAVFAAFVLLKRGAEETEEAARLFLRLLGLSCVVWTAGQLEWTVGVLRGLRPDVESPPSSRLLFIGFLVPAVAAALFGPWFRARRPGRSEVLALALLVAGAGLVFLRFVFLPMAQGVVVRPFSKGLLASLCLGLTLLGLAHVALSDDDAWRRRYLRLALFGLSYGVGSALANGLTTMPPLGGPLDLAWMVPFFFLAGIARAGVRPFPPLDAAALVWTLGALPFAVELAGAVLEPEGLGLGGRDLVVSSSLLLALGAVARAQWDGRRAGGAVGTEEADQLEEERRSGRLESLAGVARPLVADLRKAIDTLGLRAEAALPALGAEATSVAEQVRRAHLLTTEIEGALARSPPQERRPVDVARLVEEVLQAEVDGGLDLKVRVVVAPAGVPRVSADRQGLEAAVRELARNAAQASPGGQLEVQVDREGGTVRLRFLDDGPGIPEEIRGHVFDPFFTTRRAGEGVGLGLTLVHFVSRELGGSVRVEPVEGRGGSVVLRLPWDPGGWGLGLLVVPVLATAVVCVLAAADLRYSTMVVSVALSAASGLAFAALAQAAVRGPVFLFLVGLGALLPGLQALGVSGAGAFADGLFLAAVFLEFWPLRRDLTGPRRALAFLAVVLFALMHAWLVVRSPAMGPASSPSLVVATALFQRLLLASAAAAVGERSRAEATRRGLDGLALALALWSVGDVGALGLARLPSLSGLPLRSLAALPPLLLLAAVGRREARLAAAPGPA